MPGPPGPTENQTSVFRKSIQPDMQALKYPTEKTIVPFTVPFTVFKFEQPADKWPPVMDRRVMHVTPT